MYRIICLAFVLCCSCRIGRVLVYEPKAKGSGITGSAFYEEVKAMQWQQRDSVAEKLILEGNVPDFNRRFVKIKTSIVESSAGKIIHAFYYVTKDYLSIGTNDDWARVPLTPMTAQRIADKWKCFLPTRKMVNDIYAAAEIKLEPIPMTEFRDSSTTMYAHHLLIEEQRKGRKGLIAGIKKDVVISDKLTRDPKKNRVAIYGWHKVDGKAIQPLYTGHVNWYADYSHGIRLVDQYIYVEGKAMHYTDVMKHPVLRKLICDEEYCDVFRYE